MSKMVFFYFSFFTPNDSIKSISIFHSANYISLFERNTVQYFGNWVASSSSNCNNYVQVQQLLHHFALFDQSLGFQCNAFGSMLEVDLLDVSFLCLSTNSLFSVKMYWPL